MHFQESIYSVTNSFEGNIFVNQSLDGTLKVSDYVSQLFPALSTQGVAAVTEQYAGLGVPNISQASMIMGECEYLIA